MLLPFPRLCGRDEWWNRFFKHFQSFFKALNCTWLTQYHQSQSLERTKSCIQKLDSWPRHFLTSLAKELTQLQTNHTTGTLLYTWHPLGLTGWMWTFKSKPHTHTHTSRHEGRQRGAHTLGKQCGYLLWLFIIKTPCHMQDVWMWAARHSWLSHKQTTQVEPELHWSCNRTPFHRTTSRARKYFKRLDRAHSNFQPCC